MADISRIKHMDTSREKEAYYNDHFDISRSEFSF